jgi:hypothetical protein
VRAPIPYIAGLYDGDGSFTINVTRHPSIPTGYQVSFAVELSLAECDRSAFDAVTDAFPGLRFRVERDKLGMCKLRLRGEEDVLSFLEAVEPHLRVFTSVRRAEAVRRAVEAVLDGRRGMHYGSEARFGLLRGLAAEARRYAKRGAGLRRNVEAARDLERLREEGLSYVPGPLGVEYVAGLFDAEGYAGLCIRRHPRALLGFLVQPIVNLNLAIYDAAVLLKMKEMFKELSPQVKFREQNNTAYFQVTGVENAKRFLTAVHPLLRVPSRRRRVEIVLKAIEFMEEGRHRTEEGRRLLLELVAELRSLSKRRRWT